jgi:hypothetical protein
MLLITESGPTTTSGKAAHKLDAETEDFHRERAALLAQLARRILHARSWPGADDKQHTSDILPPC